MGELGWTTIQEEIHARKLRYLNHWISLPEDRWAKKIGKIGLRKPPTQRPYWWHEISDLLQGYKLDISDLLIQPSSSETPEAPQSWDTTVNRAVKDTATRLWEVNMKHKSSLAIYCHKLDRRLNPDLTGDTASKLLVKFAAGDLQLDARKHSWDQSTNPLCKLCLLSPETEAHMLLSCKAYDNKRQALMKTLEVVWDEETMVLWKSMPPDLKAARLLGIYTDEDGSPIPEDENPIPYVKPFLVDIWNTRTKALENRNLLLSNPP